MSKPKHTGRYIGGPLDGGAVTPGGRWGIYRTEDGEPLKAPEGDRQFLHHRQRGEETRRYYVHASQPQLKQLPDGSHVIEHLYVHSAYYKAWRTQQSA